jgi:hypothetical protein
MPGDVTHKWHSTVTSTVPYVAGGLALIAIGRVIASGLSQRTKCDGSRL